MWSPTVSTFRNPLKTPHLYLQPCDYDAASLDQLDIIDFYVYKAVENRSMRDLAEPFRFGFGKKPVCA